MGKRNNKAYYKGTKSKKQKHYAILQPGMSGFIVTYPRGKDNQVKGEAFDLLNSYATKLYGDQHAETCSEDDECEDIEAALKKQVHQLKEERSKERFKLADSGVSLSLFMSSTLTDPCELVYAIMKDVKNQGQTNSRFILRLLPVQASCRAEVTAIEQCIMSVIENYMKTANNDVERLTYKLETKIRNNSGEGLSSLKIKGDVGRAIHDKFPSWKVDFHNPQFHVLVDIFKTVCCVSLVENYTQYKRFNIQELKKQHTQTVLDSSEQEQTTAHTESVQEDDLLESKQLDAECTENKSKESPGSNEEQLCSETNMEKNKVIDVHTDDVDDKSRKRDEGSHDLITGDCLINTTAKDETNDCTNV